MTNEKQLTTENSLFRLTAPEENAKNMSDKKETIETRNLIVFNEGHFQKLATVRWYMSRLSNANRVYCSIWLTDNTFGNYRSGHGMSSGYGFCKQSDAFELALNSAGIYSKQPISGRGIEEVDRCLMNMAEHAGYEHAYIAQG